MMIVCMLQTVAGSALKCHDFCRRRDFEERHLGVVLGNAPAVLVHPALNDRWRIVNDPLQWILKHREGRPSKKSSG